jgi:hypothetical protein
MYLTIVFMASDLRRASLLLPVPISLADVLVGGEVAAVTVAPTIADPPSPRQDGRRIQTRMRLELDLERRAR